LVVCKGNKTFGGAFTYKLKEGACGGARSSVGRQASKLARSVGLFQPVGQGIGQQGTPFHEKNKHLIPS
jgi:hypothetical protein